MIQISREVPQHRLHWSAFLLYFELFVDVSVFVISTLLRMRAFYLICFYCRIVHIPHSD